MGNGMSEGHRRRISEGCKAHWRENPKGPATDDHRAAISAGLREWWATRDDTHRAQPFGECRRCGKSHARKHAWCRTCHKEYEKARTQLDPDPHG